MSSVATTHLSLCGSLEQMESSLLANTEQRPDSTKNIRQHLEKPFSFKPDCYTCGKRATRKSRVAHCVVGDGTTKVWSHPDCTIEHNEKLTSALSLAKTVKSAMMKEEYFVGDDPSELGSFVCAIGRGSHTITAEVPALKVRSTKVSGSQARVCRPCLASVVLYTDSMSRAFQTATRDASGSVLLSDIEASPEYKQVVKVPWERATELHKDSHWGECTAETCTMAAMTVAEK